MTDSGGNGTQRDIGELSAKVESLQGFVRDVRDEQRRGFSEVKGAVHTLGAEFRTSLANCQAHAETERRRIVSAQARTRTAASWARTAAVGAWIVLGTLAAWLWAHVTGGR